MNKPLFSVVVLVYRHYEHLKTAVNSVLEQDYENIELIISDDGSSNFPARKIEEYIEQNKRENIRSVTVRCEPQNVGTVRHINHVKEYCKGQYLIFLAGDDALYNAQVLTNYYEGFQKAPEGCCIEMAQTAMFDEKLEKLMGYYMSKPVQDAVVETAINTDALKKMLAIYGACLPTTSTCFKREFFERFGDCNEEYKLVEDFPMHCRLANEGWVIHYVNRVTIKHRDGGISHGQSDTLSASARSYYSDLLKMDQEMVMPLVEQLPPEEQKFARRHWKKDIRWLDMNLHREDKSLKQRAYRLAYYLKHNFKNIEAQRDVLLKFFMVFCVAKGWIEQMYLQVFAMDVHYIFNAVMVCVLILYALLSAMACMRHFVWKIKAFPWEAISLG